MGENDLQINITAVDEATETINSVGSSVGGLVETVTQSGNLMAEAFTASEEAVIQSAEAAATAVGNAYENVVSEVSSSLQSGSKNLDEWFQTATNSQIAALEEFDARMADKAAAMATIGEEAGAAFGTGFVEGSIPSFEASVADLNAQLRAFDLQAAADGEQAGVAYGEGFMATGEKAMEGAFGYFKYLMVAYMGQQLGQQLLGPVQADIGIAAGTPNQIASLKAQIDQQKSTIDVSRAALTKWNGTTLEVGAAHEKARTTIEAATVKIAELKRQLEPLQAAYNQSKDSIDAYDAAMQKLNNHYAAWQSAEGTTLLPLLTKLAVVLDDVVTKMTAFADAHPKMAEAMLIFMAVLGGVITLLSGLVIWFAIFFIAVDLFGAFWLGIGAAVLIGLAAAVAVIVVWGPQILSAMKKVWDGLINIVSDAMLYIFNLLSKEYAAILKDWQDFWNGIEQFVAGIATKIQTDVNNIVNAVKNLPGTLVSGAGGLLTGAIGGAGNIIGGAIHAFADGGIVNGPTLALVGEAGPEAIIPLSAFNGGNTLGGGGNGGGGGNIVVNITGTFLSQDAARQLANMMAASVNRQIKMRSFV